MIDIARTQKSMTNRLDSFESDTEKEHDVAVAAEVTAQKNSGIRRTTAQVSMNKDEKVRLTTKTKVHGLSWSAFLD